MAYLNVHGMPDEQPPFPPPAPALLHVPGAPIRVWNDVQAALKHQISRSEFNTWIRRAVLTSLDHGTATIVVPSALVKQVIEEHYLSMLRDLLRMYAGEALELHVILNPHVEEQTLPETAAPVAAAAPPAETVLNPQPSTGSSETVEGPTSQAPAWIAAERWLTLPVMLRAALVGSELIAGVVQGRSSFLSRQLHGRYAREVEALIAVAPI